MLADEYVLTHKRIFGERYSKDHKYQKADSFSPKLEQPQMCVIIAIKKVTGKRNVLCLKKRTKASHVKSAGLTTTIHTPYEEKLVAISNAG